MNFNFTLYWFILRFYGMCMWNTKIPRARIVRLMQGIKQKTRIYNLITETKRRYSIFDAISNNAHCMWWGKGLTERWWVNFNKILHVTSFACHRHAPSAFSGLLTSADSGLAMSSCLLAIRSLSIPRYTGCPFSVAEFVWFVIMLSSHVAFVQQRPVCNLYIAPVSVGDISILLLTEKESDAGTPMVIVEVSMTMRESSIIFWKTTSQSAESGVNNVLGMGTFILRILITPLGTFVKNFKDGTS